MQIQKQDSLLFNGGFRLINMTQQQKEILPNVIKKRRQIFNNFDKTGDVFITVRDEFDHKIARFIKNNGINFKFYSKINTSSGLDSERPEELVTLLNKTKEKPIESKTQLKIFLQKQKRLKNVEINSPEYVDKILKTLLIDNKHKISMVKGAIVIDDKEFQRKIFISPASKMNIHYVKVQPNSKNMLSEKYAMSPDGIILARYTSPEAIIKFDQVFKKLLID